jgi:hypothetical protein
LLCLLIQKVGQYFILFSYQIYQMNPYHKDAVDSFLSGIYT